MQALSCQHQPRNITTPRNPETRTDNMSGMATDQTPGPTQMTMEQMQDAYQQIERNWQQAERQMAAREQEMNDRRILTTLLQYKLLRYKSLSLTNLTRCKVLKPEAGYQPKENVANASIAKINEKAGATKRILRNESWG